VQSGCCNTRKSALSPQEVFNRSYSRRPNPHLDLLEQFVAERLLANHLDEEHDPLVSTVKRLLSHDERVLDNVESRRSSVEDGSRGSEGVENLVELGGAESNARGCRMVVEALWEASYGVARTTLRQRMGERRRTSTLEPGRIRIKGKSIRFRTPSDRPSMSNPPPLPACEPVIMLRLSK